MRVCASVCVHVRACVRACVRVCVCDDDVGVYMFWSPCIIITIIFPFTSAPVNDDDVWELNSHLRVRCLHVTSRAGLGVEICEGSWHAYKPLVKKTTQEYRR